MTALKKNPSELRFMSKTFLKFYRRMKAQPARQRRFLIIAKRIITARADIPGLVVLTAVERRYHQAEYKRISRDNAWRIWCICRESQAFRRPDHNTRTQQIRPRAEPASTTPVHISYRRRRQVIT